MSTVTQRRNARRRTEDRYRRKIVQLLWQRYNSADGKHYGVLSQARLAALLNIPQSQIGRAMSGPRLQRICEHMHPGFRVLMRRTEQGYLYHIAARTDPADFAQTVARLNRGDPILDRSVEELKVREPLSLTVEYLTDALEANATQRQALVRALEIQREVPA